ncbi:MAG: thiamine pyrophosphate-dependent enzyme, partial [Chloroflexi bacterium]|nr:thiamine pyrophosphate-dependent enzyme [Chloroflexota bacterium]
MTTPAPAQTNQAGLSKNDYRGLPSTLCQGCGHNSIANQIITACYDLNIVPEEIMKFSGIGCSSKSPAYFLNRSFGFNGVYGLTKGQFSATAEVGLDLKHQGINQYMPVDICMEALASNATFVARSFAGDAKQVKELLKAALSHHGVAVLDIISPCVTFNNQEDATHSYTWGKDHEAPLHEISFIPALDEIELQGEFAEGNVREVSMHDGSIVLLKKLEKDYDPTSRANAFQMLESAQLNNWLVTGLLYIDESKPTLT